MLTTIHPTYKENLLAAINRYLSSKPQHSLERIEDMLALRKIIESDYEDHLTLVLALKKYVQNINTGFYLFGIKRFHIKTGNSRLKQYVEEAMDSMSLTSLEEWGQSYKLGTERMQSADTASMGSVSSEEFLAHLQCVEAENAKLKQERAVLDETCRQMILQYNRLKMSFETLQTSHNERQVLLDKLIDENQQLRTTQQSADTLVNDFEQEHDIFVSSHTAPLFSSALKSHRPLL